MKPIYRKIESDNDIVVVTNKNGVRMYRGLQRYEPFRDKPWVYNELYNYYEYNGMTKKCLNSNS